MQNILRLLIIVVAYPQFALAADVLGTLQGDVLDSRTGHGVASASVQVSFVLNANAIAQEIPTDSLGHFQATLPTGPVDLVVSAMGYESLRINNIEVKSGASLNQLIHLRDLSVNELNSTIVKAPKLLQRDPQQSTSVSHMTQDQLNNSPGSSQDVNRVLTSLPAVSLTSNDNYTSFVVRGGGAAENTFLVDGIEIANLSHWGDEYTNGGAISMLNLDFVRDLDFYAGGMPAGMPARISSVTDIRLRDGSFTQHSEQFDLNMAGAGAYVEGPLITDKVSYMVSARVSFLELIAGMMPFNGVPEYQNAESKIVARLGNMGKLSWNVLAGQETIKMDNGKDGTLTSDGGHVISGLEWKVGRDSWSNSLLASGVYTNFAAHQDANNLSVFRYTTDDSRLQIKDQWEFYPHDRDLISLGAVVQQERTKERYVNDPYYLAFVGDSVQYVRSLPNGYPDTLWHDSLGGTNSFADTTYYRIGANASYVWNANLWSIQLGARDDYYTLIRKQGLSPRLSVTRALPGDRQISASASMLQQFPDMFRLMDLVDNDSGVALQSMRLQRAWVGALGYKQALGSVVELDGEAYGKWYDQEPRYHINDSSGQRDISVDPFHNWHRRVAGLEFHLQKQHQDIFYYELAYSFTFAQQQYDNNQWMTADDNLLNSAHIILGSRFRKEDAVSMRLDVSDGRPTTPMDTARSLAEYTTVYKTNDGWNNTRGPAIFNLSLRYSHNSYFTWGRVESYMEATNILNRTYAVYENYDRGNGPQDGSITSFPSRGFFFVGGVSINF